MGSKAIKSFPTVAGKQDYDRMYERLHTDKGRWMLACAAFNLRKWLKKAGGSPLKVARSASKAVDSFFELSIHQIRYSLA